MNKLTTRPSFYSSIRVCRCAIFRLTPVTVWSAKVRSGPFWNDCPEGPKILMEQTLTGWSSKWPNSAQPCTSASERMDGEIINFWTIKKWSNYWFFKFPPDGAPEFGGSAWTRNWCSQSENSLSWKWFFNGRQIFLFYGPTRKRSNHNLGHFNR